MARRDYGLDGPDTRAAIAAGFAEAEWYQAPIEPERLKALTIRRNGRPAADAILWLALLAGAATASFVSLGTWWAIPAFGAFGTLWGGSSDARWHEHGHGTAFKAGWPNDAMYDVTAFMMLREPTMWRFQHARHHSYTGVVGLDPEIGVRRPPSFAAVALSYLNLVNGPKLVWRIVQHAAGHCDAYTREIVPADHLRRVVLEARLFVAVLGGALVAAIAAGTVVPLLFVGLPSFYGFWMAWFFGVTQHAGLREDVVDHRMSTRTVYINPVLRFLYLNMNYHVEHHMFPAVPYYNLPALHEEIKAYLPPPRPSMWAAYREVFHALGLQRADPGFEIDLGWQPPAEPAAGSLPRGAVVSLPAAASGGEVDLGPAELLRPGDLGQVDVGERHLLLCRMLDGGYALTDGVCTHGRTLLAGGILDGCVVECPKHNGRFDVQTGEAVRLPARRPLATYPVVVRSGRLLATLPPEVDGSPGAGLRRPVVQPAAVAGDRHVRQGGPQ